MIEWSQYVTQCYTLYLQSEWDYATRIRERSQEITPLTLSQIILRTQPSQFAFSFLSSRRLKLDEIDPTKTK